VVLAQPKAWELLTKNHRSAATETFLTRLRDQIDRRGTLDVLRHGIELLGLKAPLMLAQFKPALAINADILARYAENRLRVVRQVKYSVANENCIDLVFFARCRRSCLDGLIRANRYLVLGSFTRGGTVHSRQWP